MQNKGKVCLNKKVKCEYCDREFNRTYISKHMKKYQNIIIEPCKLNNEIVNNDKNLNRTLIVGPSFCGKS